jgi:hypothetical protein
MWNQIECDPSWENDPINGGEYTAQINPTCDPKTVNQHVDFCQGAGEYFVGKDEVTRMNDAGWSTPANEYTYHGVKSSSSYYGVTLSMVINDCTTNQDCISACKSDSLDHPGACDKMTCNSGRCNAGTYFAPEWCIQCPSGTVSPLDEHRLSCDICGPGRYASYNDPDGLEDQEECLDCPAGWYSDNSKNANCKPCAMGKFQELEMETTCEQCPAGFYQDTATDGADECKSCFAGTYSGQEAGFCIVCKQGEYQDKEEATDCLLCPPRFYLTHAGTVPWTKVTGLAGVDVSDRLEHDDEDDCDFCDPSKGMRTDRPYFIPGDPPSGHESGSTDCTSCPPGTYIDVSKPVPECEACKTCDPGWTMMENHVGIQRSRCREASPGVCHECPQGFFKSESGNWWTPCEFCPGGTQPNKEQTDSNGVVTASARTECEYCDYGPHEYAANAVRHYKPHPLHDYGFNDWLDQRDAALMPNDGWTMSCANPDGMCYTWDNIPPMNMTSELNFPIACDQPCYSHAESGQLCADFTCPDRSFPNENRTACLAIKTVTIVDAGASDPQNPRQGALKDTKRGVPVRCHFDFSLLSLFLFLFLFHFRFLLSFLVLFFSSSVPPPPSPLLPPVQFF